MHQRILRILLTMMLTLSVAISSGVVFSGPLDDAQAAYERGDYATALQLLRLLAERGDAEARFHLGMMYARGDGVAQDNKEAVKWYRLAAEQCSRAISSWIFVRRRTWSRAGSQGSSEMVSARRGAGRMGCSVQSRFYVRRGLGVPQHYEEALKWYRLAAAQGFAPAQYQIGRMAREGEGIPQDDKEAVKWYRLAAVQGNADAQNGLGFMYYTGLGVTQNYQEALKWYRLAAAQGNAAAQHNLGAMYLDGNGVANGFNSRSHLVQYCCRAGDR